MAEPPDSNPTIVAAGLKLGTGVVQALSPNFLALICVNCLFLGTLYWFVDARARHTAELLQQLLSACLTNNN